MRAMFDAEKSDNFGLVLSRKVCEQFGGKLTLDKSARGRHIFAFSVKCRHPSQSSNSVHLLSHESHDSIDAERV